MNATQQQDLDPSLVAKGRSYYRMAAVATMAIHLGFLVEEIVTWNSLGFVITEVVLATAVGLLWLQVARNGRLRWLLFMAIALGGVFGFLLGGLHITDPKEAPIDPLCYWLAGGGLAILGIGGYYLYSIEIDAYLRDLRGRQPAE